jgi:hypothetical protein
MALVKQDVKTTSETILTKGPICHVCRERKSGLYGRDVYGNPRCADCCRAANQPID